VDRNWEKKESQAKNHLAEDGVEGAGIDGTAQAKIAALCPSCD